MGRQRCFDALIVLLLLFPGCRRADGEAGTASSVPVDEGEMDPLLMDILLHPEFFPVPQPGGIKVVEITGPRDLSGTAPKPFVASVAAAGSRCPTSYIRMDIGMSTVVKHASMPLGLLVLHNRDIHNQHEVRQQMRGPVGLQGDLQLDGDAQRRVFRLSERPRRRLIGRDDGERESTSSCCCYSWGEFWGRVAASRGAGTESEAPSGCSSGRRRAQGHREGVPRGRQLQLCRAAGV